ncbi:terpene synthase-like [Zophobas morio]|uniref:terpene synthase-like n=1 Tax=Zophobas morio TaxID=2755281 RepID=UPI003083E920
MTASEVQMQLKDEEILLAPIIHITQHGTQYRSIMRRLWRACNHWIKCPKDLQKIYGDIGDTLYTVGLILDDIEDFTKIRRGIPCAYMVYGVPLTVQAIIHKSILLFQELIYHLGDSEELADEFIRVGVNLMTGQGMEIYYRDTEKCPTFDDFRVVVHGKASYTFMYGVRLLEMFAKTKKINFSHEFWDKMGYFIQVYNDYINLRDPKWAAVRIFCDDLDEGKFSYPIVHAIQSHPEDHRLTNMLKERPLDLESKKLFVDIMESFGSFEHSRQFLEDLKCGIIEEVKKMKLERNPHLERVLDNIFANLETKLFI